MWHYSQVYARYTPHIGNQKQAKVWILGKSNLVSQWALSGLLASPKSTPEWVLLKKTDNLEHATQLADSSTGWRLSARPLVWSGLVWISLSSFTTYACLGRKGRSIPGQFQGLSEALSCLLSVLKDLPHREECFTSFRTPCTLKSFPPRWKGFYLRRNC